MTMYATQKYENSSTIRNLHYKFLQNFSSINFMKEKNVKEEKKIIALKDAENI